MMFGRCPTKADLSEFAAGHGSARIAKHIVDQYPESPQAGALRDQIPLLEQRIAV